MGSQASDKRECRNTRGGRQRIGLLGGSFNPAHDGHLHISRIALQRLELDAVWWLVSPQNPLKATADMAPMAQRLGSARSIARDPRLRISDVEHRLGTRYTVDTLRALKRRRPHADFVLLVGADILSELPRWHRWERLFGLVPIAVFDRKPYSVRALSGLAAQRFARFRIAEQAAACLASRKPPAWVFLHIRAHSASATAIRALRRGRAGAKH